VFRLHLWICLVKAFHSKGHLRVFWLRCYNNCQKCSAWRQH
jgi:hypothetical protein